jgi:hypothetical protein
MLLDGSNYIGGILWQDQGKSRRTHQDAFEGLFAGIDAKAPDRMIAADNILLWHGKWMAQPDFLWEDHAPLNI